MTIRNAIDALDTARCNAVALPVKLRWLSKLDGQIHQDVLLTHEHSAELAHFCGYDEKTDEQTVLLIGAPYDEEIYPVYLEMMLERENGEMDKYNRSATLFNQALLAYQDWYNRKTLPLHGGRRFVF